MEAPWAPAGDKRLGPMNVKITSELTLDFFIRCTKNLRAVVIVSIKICPWRGNFNLKVASKLVGKIALELRPR